MLKRFMQALILPSEVTAFERAHLRRMNRVALLFFCAHVPVFMGVAALCGTGAWLAFSLTCLTLVGPTIAYFTFKNPRNVSLAFGFTAMCLGGLLVHFGQGSMQIEMHFYFFVLIALAAVFGNPSVIIVSALTVSLHHLILFFALPSSVFNYDAPLWAVLVHALFVVLESVAACFVARSFFNNVIGLEQIVAGRTAQLDARNADMGLILENVGQGFVTLERDGTMSNERSAAATRLLGDTAPRATFASCLAGIDEDAGAWFKVGWDAVIDDIMPLELTVAQLPRRLTRDGRHLDLAYRPIMADGALAKMLVVISDVTSDVDRNRVEGEQRELLDIFQRIATDKAGFLEFHAEGNAILAAIGGRHLGTADLLRSVHTMKGNAGMFGLAGVVDSCHALEQTLADEGPLGADREIDAVVSKWNAFTGKLHYFLGEHTSGIIEVNDGELQDALGAMERGDSPDDVASMMRAWRLEPTARRLARVADRARSIAQRSGKANAAIRVEANNVRLDADVWTTLWSAVTHAVRNALDHGIEGPDERAANGKPIEAAITLRTLARDDLFVIEIEDDGRGVDWQTVRERAIALGLPSATDEDLVEALFANGLTTKTGVTEFSGRGVGMGALRAECRRRGGQVVLESRPGAGTRLRLEFPLGFSAPHRTRRADSVDFRAAWSA